MPNKGWGEEEQDREKRERRKKKGGKEAGAGSKWDEEKCKEKKMEPAVLSASGGLRAFQDDISNPYKADSLSMNLPFIQIGSFIFNKQYILKKKTIYLFFIFIYF